MDGVDARPARDRGLSELRCRPARPAPRHPVRHRGPCDDLRRGHRRMAVETETGEMFVTPFVVAASGILSVPLEPDIPGMDAFAGASLYTSRLPEEGSTSPVTGRRHRNRFDRCTAHSGRGAGGRTLSVFQRSPAYTLPWQVRAFEPGELDEMKARLRRDPRGAARTPVGAARSAPSRAMLEMIIGRR